MTGKKITDELKSVFVYALELDSLNDVESLSYRSVPTWDSIGHMALVAEIEEKFMIEFTTQQVLDFSNFNKALHIVETLLEAKIDE